MQIQIASTVVNYVESLPSKSAYQLGYDFGFGLEKVGEFALTRRVGSFGMNAAKNIPGFKWLRSKGRGEINDFSISKGSGYGARPRFDFQELKNTYNSRITSKMTIPKWRDGWKLPHWHRGKGNNLRYHRPWEKSPDGKRKW